MKWALVVYINGSHQWHQKELQHFFSFNSQNLEGMKQYLNEKGIHYKLSYMTLKKGQFSVHSCRTIHCSPQNISNKNRIALVMHFQDESNRYQPAFNQNGEKITIGYDKLCRTDKFGNPDYQDPNLFPLI
ncbi:phytanoyl-CoA dioxygenase family protein [Marinomonas sp. GJ51-6]|uniref:phytanoyl-CoA dioxygenase family protein n=1 Tax=Marinomonas sp. GJ51-6 TaxID=2992802 RepID=UPI0039777DDC